MEKDELCVRAFQEFAKRWDWIFRKHLPGGSGGEGTSHAARPARFFFGSNQVPEILQCLRHRLPQAVISIVERAERICHHQFDLLGYERVDYGPRIDWHLDAIHGKQAPRRPWFKVRYLDFEEVGDSKVTWELNRHQHLVTLAKAYRLTGETRYALEIFEQWYDWHRSNPYGVGINWASSLEVAFRSLSWLWVRHLLEGCPVVPQRFPQDLHRALMLNARHIERYLSTYFSPNTHLLGEGVGLFFIGTLCPGSPLAERARQHGWQIVLQQARRQVRSDGLHFEQSMYYHVYALDLLIHAELLAAGNGIPIPATLDDSIRKMLEALHALLNAGPAPRFGDDDGGRLFDAGRNRAEHFRDPLGTGAVLFNRGDFKAEAGDLCEESLWLLGAEGGQRFDALAPRPKERASFALDASGIHVMCSAKRDGQQLMIDAGPHGAGRGGHGHADALSIQMVLDGQPVLIDPGAFAYVGPGNERNQFRRTAAHNTVQVDVCSQSEPAGPFAWHNIAGTSVERWTAGTKFDFFAASHDGYDRLPSAVRHRRYVFYAKPDFWFVRDVLEGNGAHGLDVFWHFAPGRVDGHSGDLRFYRDGQAALALLFAGAHDWTQEISQGWNSPVYGRREPAPVVRFSARAALPVECGTLLAPVSRARTQTGCLRSFQSSHTGVTVHAYRFFLGEYFGYLFFADQAGTWQAGDWLSDARFVYCTMDASGNPGDLVISDGSYLELRGRRIFSSRTPLAWCERQGAISRAG